MATSLPVDRILASLEEQRAFHKEREAFHAGQAALHQEQRAVHAAEYERLTQHYEAFKASAGAAAELAARTLPAETKPPAPEKPREEEEEEEEEEEALPPGMRRSRLVEKVLSALPAGMQVGPAWVTYEINRRFGRQLPRPVSVRLVSNHLRQMVAGGRLELARPGTSHREALYRTI